MKCPSCKSEIAANYVADLTKDSRFSMVLSPKPGELMQAQTVGGMLVDMDKLFAAINKESGVKTILLVEGISQREDGALTFDFLCARSSAQKNEASK